MEDNPITPFHKWFLRFYVGVPVAMLILLLCYWAYMEL